MLITRNVGHMDTITFRNTTDVVSGIDSLVASSLKVRFCDCDRFRLVAGELWGTRTVQAIWQLLTTTREKREREG